MAPRPFLHLGAFLAAVLSVGRPGTIKYSRLAKERAHIRDARERDGCRQVHRILCGRVLPFLSSGSVRWAFRCALFSRVGTPRAAAVQERACTPVA
ncbi:hypothetical protein MTO96_023282 [Rhipicephalus appendiculatus]